MSGVNLVRETTIVRTPRVMQMEGIFDIPPSERSGEQWTINLQPPEAWNVGLIVGPSGSGKTTVARELFSKNIVTGWDWPADKSLLDGFPAGMGIKEIIELLSSVGFSSPPSWVRPFHVLSNGEQFRVNMARTLSEMQDLAVVDEFTSVVDRTVAQIGSAAIAKTVRRRNQKFIAVSCHYDIIDWLEPDWVYQPHTNEFYSGRYLHQRPKIELEVKRVRNSAWQLFRKHHYLDTEMNDAAVSFCAFWKGVPVAFYSLLHFPHPKTKNMKRGHRSVTLPDYQGVGISNAFSAYIGAMCRGLGYRFVFQTSHPAYINACSRSSKWDMYQAPTYKRALAGSTSGVRSWFENARKRLVASFEYVGPALPREEAERVWSGV